MQKLLIISYFFPPCNLTASERVSSWARHLNKYGYYPTVVTRRWDNNIKTLADISIATPNEILHEKNDSFEVYYLPYVPNLKDKIYTKYGSSKLTFLRKGLSLIELIMQRFSNSFIPYNNLGVFADNYLKDNRDVKKLIISGNPYILFKYGYQLKKKYGLRWIADYRDAWTTSEINLLSKSSIHIWLRKSDEMFERKWVSTASGVTSVSEPLLKEISDFVNVKGKWISNGFELGEFDKYINCDPFETFTITYVGTLYPGQQIEIFCNAFKQFIDQNKSLNIKLLFPGLAFDKEQNERINKVLNGYESFFECTERTNKEKILEIEARSQILLYPAWKGYSGVIASKIYEYISSGTHTLVVPSDNGEVEKIINISECGTCTNTVEETLAFLGKTYQLYKQGIKLKANLTGEKAMFFSREHQAKRMAELLDSI
jgi:glycosyltransferase involved in cell wall biosynthesis